MHAAVESRLWVRLPLFLLIWGTAALSMALPAIHALVRGNYPVFRSFAMAGGLGMVAVILIALSGVPRSGNWTRSQLLSLLGTFAILPGYLAVPLHDALQTTTFLNAYFDMVSAITTTGADIFNDPDRLGATLHLWRAQVGWMGGLFMWVAAAAILAPLSLGGFEITARSQLGRGTDIPLQQKAADPRYRLVRITKTLAPLYAGLTIVAWVLLLMSGDTSLVALSHAMSVMATSGISPVGGLTNMSSGLAGEFVMFMFMFFALSRLTFSSDTALLGAARLTQDPEFRIGLLLILGVPSLLFLRHFLGAYDVDAVNQVGAALQAFWGAMFTVMSFLTTTGFVSADWEQARLWSGLETPGMILMGLAVMGGGVATTAGGVKLLRVYALYLNGLRELQLLVHPSSIGAQLKGRQRIRKGGAFIAWMSFMLFALTLAVLIVVLAATGVDFEQAVVLAIATLSTTGPLIDVVSETPIYLIDLGPLAKGILCAAMVLGRLETLAIIALFTPSLWRN
ncbi:TrkH family potassium uptake protein [Pontibaca salina]|uniref:TrkH family potassium uptake protein n=1 Tax=Pontibaca salina TaxID=2795731 RepID=A0A934HIZ3_9RHOB|nr:potassium transporter TrkG [Pontibaca salina]MBI6629044.1 TrkH family potassium uptake protein [Pontibaca salina]